MPPRTTQQSHRPRVSDRTMVGNCHTLLAGAKKPHGRTQMHMPPKPPAEGEKQNHAPAKLSQLQTGAGCQRNIPSRHRGNVFSLDIPFYRTRPHPAHVCGPRSLSPESGVFSCLILFRILLASASRSSRARSTSLRDFLMWEESRRSCVVEEL